MKAGIAPDQIKYYRAKQGLEVDFVIDTVSHSLPIEVKYKKEVRASDTRGIKKFLELYHGEKGYVINLGEIDVNGPIQKRDCFTLQDIAITQKRFIELSKKGEKMLEVALKELKTGKTKTFNTAEGLIKDLRNEKS